MGDIVWCLFPESLGKPESKPRPKPGPKPRPALVIELGFIENNKPIVTVIYGTTQKLNRLYPSEFMIEKKDGASFALSGLAYDTKFDFNHHVKLSYCTTWFGVPAGKLVGTQPKLGVLAPNLVARAAAAYQHKR